MSEPKVCPKCSGQMERGGLRADSSLVWGRIKETTIFGVKAVQMIPPAYVIDAYRCGNCGYLEMYASREQGK